MSFFDIEKAYPSVCKDALWRLLGHKKCPKKMIKVLKAPNGHTAYAVRIFGSESAQWVPEHGLREGCRFASEIRGLVRRSWLRR